MSERSTAEDYADALIHLEDRLPKSYRNILLSHYAMPNRDITATQLAEAVGYKNYNAANLNYGELGKRFGRELGQGGAIRVLVEFEHREGEWHWIMRPQVAEALEILGWVGVEDEIVKPEEPENEKAKVSNLNTILFGPPGTGKTYNVQRKAVEVIEPSAAKVSDKEIGEKFRAYRKDGRIEFVTFHPSFSYEEFVEGFRYDSEKKTPTLHGGIFKYICGEAEKNPGELYVLVIDEINRGNISRIFGELITLLEPDKRRGAENELAVRLPYSQGDFSVPRNLHVIGTMNTADRSIALLDVALRRRFEFEEMMPDVKVVRDVLNERDADVDVELICEVFGILNARISVLLDRDHQLGHAYFLSATSPENLHHALYKRIFPLLQEYFYNDPDRLKKLLGKYEGETGFIEKSSPKTGHGFTENPNADGLWEFHVYEASALEDALRRTFVSGG